MPNWCFTSYVVEGDKKELNDLYKKMKSLENCSSSLVENASNKTSLGDLITSLGGDCEIVKCRGSWEGLAIRGGAMCFSTYTTWTDAIEAIEFINSKYPSLNFYYMAEEPETEYFVCNDTEGHVFSQRYYFCPNVYYDDGRYYSYAELNEFLRDVAEFVGKPINSISEAKNVISEYIDNHRDEDGYPEIRIIKMV